MYMDPSYSQGIGHTTHSPGNYIPNKKKFEAGITSLWEAATTRVCGREVAA
jgi:hypothetical protein